MLDGGTNKVLEFRSSVALDNSKFAHYIRYFKVIAIFVDENMACTKGVATSWVQLELVTNWLVQVMSKLILESELKFQLEIVTSWVELIGLLTR